MLKVERKGFTLLEVIITLSLIALLSSLFISNLDTLFNSVSRKNPEKTLVEVVNRASNLAQSRGEEIKLSFDEEANALILSAYLNDEPLESYGSSMEGLEVSFEPVYPKVIDGSESTFKMVEEVDCMRFYPDATSSKVRITLEYGNREYSVIFDTFSAMKLEDSDKDED